MSALDGVIGEMIEYGLAQQHEIRGLTEDEISEVEADQATPLPGVYREFLKTMGKGAGRLLVGSDAFYPSILGLKDAARELLAESGDPFELEESDVVVLMHQGYTFLFLRGIGEDPPVFQWVEGDPEPKQIASTLPELLSSELTLAREVDARRRELDARRGRTQLNK